MHRLKPLMIVALCASLGATACSPTPKADAGSLKVSVQSHRSGERIPDAFALCTPTPDGKSEKVKTPLRPTIAWSHVPAGTASIAVFMMDPDVPADFSDANQDGKTVKQEAARQPFFHYGSVDVPASARTLQGAKSSRTPSYGHELLNDLGANGYIAPKSAYGGPCPPWNDERIHNYHFMVLALNNTQPAHVKGETAKEAFNRLMGSDAVLVHGTVVGTFSLNPALMPAKR